MSAFLIIAACMAAIAAAVVATPLLRNANTRRVGAAAALLVMGAAAGLYPLWSNWNWHAPATNGAAGPDIGAMIGKLEQHMKDSPQDQEGWLMLGRSYLALERLDDAILAYQHAQSLGENAEAALGLGEALSLRAGGQITPQAAALFEEALALTPDDPKALLYGGFAAAVRGDRSLARSRWQRLKDLHPPAQIEQMLDTRIAELGPDAGAAAGPASGATRSADGTNASAPGTNASSAGSATAQATVKLSIAPELKARVKPESLLFLFARSPGQAGPPLAAKRMTAAAIGSQVQLSSADSMLPGRVLTAGQRVSITARVSFSGQPTPAAGDLYGELSYEVGRDGVKDLIIDRVAE